MIIGTASTPKNNYCVSLAQGQRCSLEIQSLVGSEESHEGWHSFDTDVSGFVNVVMSPGSWEVGLHV